MPTKSYEQNELVQVGGAGNKVKVFLIIVFFHKNVVCSVFIDRHQADIFRKQVQIKHQRNQAYLKVLKLLK